MLIEWLILGIFSTLGIALVFGWLWVSQKIDNKEIASELVTAKEALSEEIAVNRHPNVARVIKKNCECEEIFSLPESTERDQRIMEFLFKKQRGVID